LASLLAGAIILSRVFDRRVVGQFDRALESVVQLRHTARMVEHRKRPRDPNQLAKLIVDIATGQIEDRPPTPEEQGKDPAAAALGRKGGKARAKSMTAKRRKEIAKLAATRRWGRPGK
jgi:hypothetical protein